MKYFQDIFLKFQDSTNILYLHLKIFLKHRLRYAIRYA